MDIGNATRPLSAMKYPDLPPTANSLLAIVIIPSPRSGRTPSLQICSLISAPSQPLRPRLPTSVHRVLVPLHWAGQAHWCPSLGRLLASLGWAPAALPGLQSLEAPTALHPPNHSN